MGLWPVEVDLHPASLTVLVLDLRAGRTSVYRSANHRRPDTALGGGEAFKKAISQALRVCSAETHFAEPATRRDRG